ncbi:MAG: membrane dipeptidase [Phycisphaeraceae bacterium]
MRPLIDGHLDLALNALGIRRAITQPLEAIRAAEADLPRGPNRPFETATVSLPDLRAAGAVVVVTTLIARARPWRSCSGQAVGSLDFPDQDGAHAMAAAQLDYYHCLADRDLLRIVTAADQLPPRDATIPLTDDQPLPILLTFEGTDPVRDPDDLHRWHAQGVRTLMLAHFGRSTHAHGTPSEPDNHHPNDVDGPLTAEGRRLLPEIEKLGMPLDLTHLSDTSLYEAIDRFGGAIYASHCGARALVPECQRNLPDEVIKTIAQRGGVIGLPLHSPYLVPDFAPDTPRDRCSIEHAVDHLDHIAQITGSDRHVALGTDMDGGFGLEYTPTGIDRYAELPKLGALLETRGWSDEAINRLFAGNWHRFFASHLPAS